MINHSIKGLITLIVLTLIGCEDIFEADLSGEVVVIIAPKDGLQTEIQPNTFWWEAVEGAEGYNLQIVFILDICDATTENADNLSISLH